MFSLQHDIGKWCSEYTWSAEDGMWGVRVLHNFGRLGNPVEPSEDSSPSIGPRPKRVDEEDATGGGLKGRVSAGAEFYISAKEKSAGGTGIAPFWLGYTQFFLFSVYRNSVHDAFGLVYSVISNAVAFVISATYHNYSLVQSDDGPCFSRICRQGLPGPFFVFKV